MNFFEELKNYDTEVAAACHAELERQQHNIELIASENIVSKGVLLAAGGVLTNKYAEGYPGKRERTREKAFRRGACQCSAALRSKRKSCGILRIFKSR